MNKNQLQEFLTAISDPIRFKLLLKIFEAFLLYNPSDKPAYRGNCVTNLKKLTDLSQPTISHHLKILEDARVIIAERQGKWIHYLPNTEYIDRFKEEIDSIFSFEKPKQTHLDAVRFDADDRKLRSLIDLLRNHDIALKHYTKRKTTSSIYIEDKSSKDLFLLLYNNTTNILTIRLIGESNMISASQLIPLIKRYIQSLN
ncbi:helix-turn-helix transcriptional regulator [Candidatus Dojkabacteria bacterium]|nr:helix-turn-helix transcriptional regulator [Candidatus Dojkabacteria bacterium]